MADSGDQYDALGETYERTNTRRPTIVPDEGEFWTDLRRSPSFAVYTAKLAS